MKTPFRNLRLGSWAWILLGSVVVLGLTSCKMSKPGSFEIKCVGAWKHHVSVGDKNVKNPVADTKENVHDGQLHFAHHCQVCHGYDGQNTGVPFAEDMTPPVANLASEEVQAYSDGQLRWIIKNGIGPSGMPSWGEDLTDDEQWKLVLFIRHLPAKGSMGSPEIYKEEKEEHMHMEQGEMPMAPADHDHHHGDEKKTPAPKQDESKPHTHTHSHTH